MELSASFARTADVVAVRQQYCIALLIKGPDGTSAAWFGQQSQPRLEFSKWHISHASAHLSGPYIPRPER